VVAVEVIIMPPDQVQQEVLVEVALVLLELVLQQSV
tara:strand:- start:123 stop:230 length:108 start_codon:yes stop_codon:yes gene_type:complete